MAGCALCNKLELKRLAFRVAFDFDIQQLEKSASEGCFICSILRKGILHFAPCVGGISRIRRIYVWGSSVDRIGTLEAEVYPVDDDTSKLRLEFFQDQGANAAVTGLKQLPRIIGNTGSEQSFAFASRALDECVANHADCNSGLEPKLPTRVLSISGSGELLTVKLFEPKSLKDRYTCLSHCWGGTRSIVTLRTNIGLHRKGIAWTSLPRTFQDAITFTRKLGLQYIWIDSLCIIQDDKSDRLKEVANMSSIYQNSYITIAATSSTNDQGGCFSKESPLNHDFKLSGVGQLYVREKLVHWDTLRPCELLRAYPLLTRGWVYQERLLAPRVLHFTGKELVWECLQTSSCECSSFSPVTQPKVEHSAAIRWIRGSCTTGEKIEVKISTGPRNTQPRTITEGQSLRFSSKMGQKIDHLSALYLGDSRTNGNEGMVHTRGINLAMATLRSKWHEIVTDYSSLNLTIDRDRLPAIGGLARDAQDCRPGPYVAGLWEDSLAEDLLWQANRLDRAEQRPSIYRAPTWSWASTTVGVSYPANQRIDLRSGLRILKVICVPVNGGDAFGEICHGYMEVDGYLTRAKVIYTTLDSGDLDPRHYKLALEHELLPFKADYSLCIAGEYEIKDHEEVYCLRAFMDESSTIFLVLRLLKGGKQRYERIGIVERRNNSSKNFFSINVLEMPARGESAEATIKIF